MAPRLMDIGMPRAAGRTLSPWAQGAVVLGVLVLVIALRLLVDSWMPGLPPFSLLYPAVLAATFVAGYRAGLAVLILGGVLVAYFMMEPQRTFEARSLADIISLAIYAVTAGAIVVLAQGFRAQAAARAADDARSQWALSQTATRLRMAMEAGHMAVWHLENGVLQQDARLNELLGFPAGVELTLADVERGHEPQDLEALRKETRAAAADQKRFFEVEHRFRRPDGEVRWMLTRAEILAHPDGSWRGALGVMLDITARKDAEERMRLLAREVDHRANNLLAVVQGTVSLSRADTVEQLKQVLIGRIRALARAHQLLSEARWAGADLRRLVEEELAAFSLGDRGKVSIIGPDTALGPAAAQAVAMALHELATNAAKYGALSASGGRVDVSWSGPEVETLTIRWVESGGPAITSPPARKGLGTTMLERALAGALKGETRMDWRPEGLVCELVLPRTAARSRAAST